MGQSIKVSTAAPIVILPFHKDAFGIARTGHNAGETMAKKMSALIVSRYGNPQGASITGSNGVSGQLAGSTGPTFEQYRADCKALQQLAKDKGLASDQWVMKPFRAALKALYGKLPESNSPEAIRKAEERKAAQEAVEALRKAREVQANPAGAPKGETQDRAPSESEALESLVARVGPIKLGQALVNILKADERTAPQAVHIEKMLAKVAQIVAAASQTA